jgi:LAO/AO transport system kinase
MPELRRLCDEAGIPDIPIVVGGIIPEDDQQPLLESGIDGVFNPGTPMKVVIESVRELATKRRQQREQAGRAPDLQTQPGLARAITMVVNGQSDKLGPIPKPPGQHVRIGITGAPGVGKSTFIGKLAAQLRQRDRRVGVIAVDPTSPITGGSVLGDRLRIMKNEPDDGLFIRSLASEGEAGGLAPHCAEVSQLLAAAGYEIVLVETVGAGQNDTEVRNLTDEVLLLLMPGAGDAIQFAKAGVYEIATGFVVNKSDLPGADQTVRQLRESVAENVDVWNVSSLRNEGFDPLCEWIEQKLDA